MATSQDPVVQWALDQNAKRIAVDRQILADSKAESDRVMPENIFRAHFLPFWRGEKTLHDKDYLLNLWLTTAGGHFGRVRVVDLNGDTIATSPTVSPTDKLNLRQGRIDTNLMVEMSSRAPTPALQQAQLTNGLMQRFGEQTSNLSQAMSEHMAEWDAFLNIFNPAAAAATVQPAAAQAPAFDGFE